MKKSGGLRGQPDLHHDPKYQDLTNITGRRLRRLEEREERRRVKKQQRES